MEPFTKDETKGDDENLVLYKLQGVVRHIGNTAFSGHYTADALRTGKDRAGEDKEWVNFDDGTPSMTSIEGILDGERSQKNNYMMLYAMGKQE